MRPMSHTSPRTSTTPDPVTPAATNAGIECVSVATDTRSPSRRISALRTTGWPL